MKTCNCYWLDNKSRLRRDYLYLLIGKTRVITWAGLPISTDLKGISYSLIRLIFNTLTRRLLVSWGKFIDGLRDKIAISLDWNGTSYDSNGIAYSPNWKGTSYDSILVIVDQVMKMVHDKPVQITINALGQLRLPPKRLLQGRYQTLFQI